MDIEDNNCCAYIGKGGAGHFVKMVHNGIEYAAMQLIAEVYGILKNGIQYDQDQISAMFDDWSNTESESDLLRSLQRTIQCDALRLAYKQARIINHHQGFALISQASLTCDWNINLSKLARI